MADSVGASEQDGRKRESPIELSDDENITSNTAQSPKLPSSESGLGLDLAVDVIEKDPAKQAEVQNLYNSIRNRFSSMRDKSDTKIASKKEMTSVASATKGNTKPIGSLEKLRNLIWMAEYEAFQDPYRGIGLLQYQQKQQDDGDEVMELLTNGKKQITPWDACQFGILSDTSTGDMLSQALRQHDLNIPKHQQHPDGSLELDPNNPETLVRYLTEAQCPSLVAWTRQSVEDAAKKRASLNKKRRGKKRARIDNDGNECTVSVCLGERPSDPKYRCPCDYNPFCLGSMGGVVNDILQERCENDVSISIPDDEEDQDSGGSGINKTNFVKRLKGGNILQYMSPSNKSKHDDSSKTNNVEVVEVDKSNEGGITTIASKTLNKTLRWIQCPERQTDSSTVRYKRAKKRHPHPRWLGSYMTGS